MLNEISQTEKGKYCMISLTYRIYRNEIQSYREQIGGCQRCQIGVEEMGEGQKTQTSNYKISQSWVDNVHHGDHS